MMLIGLAAAPAGATTLIVALGILPRPADFVSRSRLAGKCLETSWFSAAESDRVEIPHFSHNERRFP